jgi:hypothetical protein
MCSAAPHGQSPARHRLTEDDDVDIWIARWLRIRRKDLIDRYGCDPRRLYRDLGGHPFPRQSEKALARFAERQSRPRRTDRSRSAPPHPQSAALEGQLELLDPADRRTKLEPKLDGADRIDLCSYYVPSV